VRAVALLTLFLFNSVMANSDEIIRLTLPIARWYSVALMLFRDGDEHCFHGEY